MFENKVKFRASYFDIIKKNKEVRVKVYIVAEAPVGVLPDKKILEDATVLAADLIFEKGFTLE